VTVVKSHCAICGDVEIEPADFRFVLHPDAKRSFYEFTCGTCHTLIRRHACRDIITLLILGGIEPERVPAEALERHDGPPLTEADRTRFVYEMYLAPDIAAAAGA